jgi:hypothetical protein
LSDAYSFRLCYEHSSLGDTGAYEAFVLGEEHGNTSVHLPDRERDQHGVMIRAG